jgi:hypothetical protein
MATAQRYETHWNNCHHSPRHFTLKDLADLRTHKSRVDYTVDKLRSNQRRTPDKPNSAF